MRYNKPQTMKTKLLIIASIFMLNTANIKAQINLIPNSSFEQYDTCPNMDGQISYAIGWENYGQSPDYFDTCSTNPDFSVPLNWGGYQQASTGNAYAGFGTYMTRMWTSGFSLREFIGGQLSSTLSIGTKYYVSFKVSLSLSNQILANCACNHIGAMFSTVPYSVPFNPSPITNNPPIYTDSIITDTLGWTKIFGSFIADSAYKYIIIGNFFDDNNTDTLIMNSDTNCLFSYYYLDDVCVSTDSVLCAIGIGIEETNWQNIVQIYPNPFNSSSTIIIKGENNLQDVALYDLIGRKQNIAIIKTFSNNEIEIKIDRGNLPQGIYLLQIQFAQEYLVQKLIITN